MAPKNYTTLTFPYPHHVDPEKRIVSVFVGNKDRTKNVMYRAMATYPAHLVQLVTFPVLEELHGD